MLFLSLQLRACAIPTAINTASVILCAFYDRCNTSYLMFLAADQ
jgi:hypothetical protein